jgi:hypothetical protein
VCVCVCVRARASSVRQHIQPVETKKADTRDKKDACGIC